MDFLSLAIGTVLGVLLGLAAARYHSSRSEKLEEKLLLQEEALTVSEQEMAFKTKQITEQEETARVMAETHRSTREELEALTRQNYILHEINKAMNATVDQEEIVAIILQAMVTLTGAESASIMFKTAKGLKILTHCGFGCSLEADDQLEERIKNTVAWKVLSSGETYFHPSKQEYSRFQPSLDSYVVAIPLIFVKEVIGCLNIHSMGPLYEMTPSKIEVLQILSGQAALALNNSTMYHRLNEQKEIFARQAITDGLTGLYNHRHFQHFLDKVLKDALQREQPISLLMFDIDHFKRFNDTYGHQFGDEVLRHLGELIRQHLEVGQLAARYGGEEFAIIYPGLTGQEAFARANALRKAIENHPIHFEEQTVHVTVSGGVALWNRDKDKSELVELADRSLYRAKANGRNRIYLADSDQQIA